MKWLEAAGVYQRRIRAARSVRDQVVDLAEVEAVGVPVGVINDLRELYAPLERQLARLDRGQFRVAVVGLEKAGKSTFINAWLEHDLLPSAQRRCTYTTTQVHSTNPGDVQRLEVIVKTEDELRRLENELQESARNSAENGAREDNENVQRHRTRLYEVVSAGNRRLEFTDLAEVGDVLREFVADESRAYAVREVLLYTNRLARTGGIVFFDVPGLNSGLAKHLEESRAMLADCDAVICIQHARHPSLVSHEKELIKFVEAGDREIGVAGKLFVFVGQIDQQTHPEPLEQSLREIRAQWSALGLAPDRIVAGSAAAHLVLTGAAGDGVRHSTERPERLGERLLQLVPSASDAVGACGINAIRERVHAYLDNERAVVLAKRCDGPIAHLTEVASRIHAQAAARFPEDPDQARREAEQRQQIEFGEWWEVRWKRLAADAQRLFEPVLREREIAADELRERYRTLVQTGLRDLPSRQDDERQRIFDRTSHPVFDPARANDAWREALYGDIARLLERTLAERLSLEILADLQHAVRALSGMLWDSQEVRRQLMGDPEQFRTALEVGLRTLFLRFARPVAKVLVRGAVGSVTRQDIGRELGPDIELIDNYYQGAEPAFRTLRKFAKYGRALLADPLVRQVVLDIAPPGVHAVLQVADKTVAVASPRAAATADEVVAEVNADLDAVEAYLVDAIFWAAGFRAFRSQELGRLWDRFVDRKGSWAGVARNEFAAENPRLMAELPVELHNASFNVEIATRLRQLRAALEASRTLNA